MIENIESVHSEATFAGMKKQLSEGKQTSRKVSHPPTSQMVDAAINSLKERGGSSMLAIKKFISANYQVDIERMAPFIKKYLKHSLETGHLVQTTGKGASGSFKMSAMSVKTGKKVLTKENKSTTEGKMTNLVKKTDEKKTKVSTKKTIDKPDVEKKKTSKAVKKVIAVKIDITKPKKKIPKASDNSHEPKVEKSRKKSPVKKPAAKKITAKEAKKK